MVEKKKEEYERLHTSNGDVEDAVWNDHQQNATGLMHHFLQLLEQSDYLTRTDLFPPPPSTSSNANNLRLFLPFLYRFLEEQGIPFDDLAGLLVEKLSEPAQKKLLNRRTSELESKCQQQEEENRTLQNQLRSCKEDNTELQRQLSQCKTERDRFQLEANQKTEALRLQTGSHDERQRRWDELLRQKTELEKDLALCKQWFEETSQRLHPSQQDSTSLSFPSSVSNGLSANSRELKEKIHTYQDALRTFVDDRKKIVPPSRPTLPARSDEDAPPRVSDPDSLENTYRQKLISFYGSMHASHALKPILFDMSEDEERKHDLDPPAERAEWIQSRCMLLLRTAEKLLEEKQQKESQQKRNESDSDESRGRRDGEQRSFDADDETRNHAFDNIPLEQWRTFATDINEFLKKNGIYDSMEDCFGFNGLKSTKIWYGYIPNICVNLVTFVNTLFRDDSMDWHIPEHIYKTEDKLKHIKETFQTLWEFKQRNDDNTKSSRVLGLMEDLLTRGGFRSLWEDSSDRDQLLDIFQKEMTKESEMPYGLPYSIITMISALRNVSASSSLPEKLSNICTKMCILQYWFRKHKALLLPSNRGSVHEESVPTTETSEQGGGDKTDIDPILLHALHRDPQLCISMLFEKQMYPIQDILGLERTRFSPDHPMTVQRLEKTTQAIVTGIQTAQSQLTETEEQRVQLTQELERAKRTPTQQEQEIRQKYDQDLSRLREEYEEKMKDIQKSLSQETEDEQGELSEELERIQRALDEKTRELQKEKEEKLQLEELRNALEQSREQEKASLSQQIQALTEQLSSRKRETTPEEESEQGMPIPILPTREQKQTQDLLDVYRQRLENIEEEEAYKRLKKEKEKLEKDLRNVQKVRVNDPSNPTPLNNSLKAEIRNQIAEKEAEMEELWNKKTREVGRGKT